MEGIYAHFANNAFSQHFYCGITSSIGGIILQTIDFGCRNGTKQRSTRRDCGGKKRSCSQYEQKSRLLGGR
jgi:hypothetical protein